MSERTVTYEGAGWAAVPTPLLRDSELSPPARLTYAILQTYAWQPERCFPGQDRVAAQVGVKVRALYGYLRELADADVITIKRRGQTKTNRYVLHPERRYARTATDRHERADHPDRHEGADPDRHERADEVDEGEIDEGTTTPDTAIPADLEPWRNVIEVVQGVATSKRAAVTAAAVVGECERFRDRAHTIEAEKFAHYWLAGKGQNRRVSDVPRAWRNWLTTAPPAAAYERRHDGRARRDRGPSGAELRAAAAQARAMGR